MLEAALEIGENNSEMAARAHCRLETMRDLITISIRHLSGGRGDEALRTLRRAEEI